MMFEITTEYPAQRTYTVTETELMGDLWPLIMSGVIFHVRKVEA